MKKIIKNYNMEITIHDTKEKRWNEKNRNVKNNQNSVNCIIINTLICNIIF